MATLIGFVKIWNPLIRVVSRGSVIDTVLAHDTTMAIK